MRAWLWMALAMVPACGTATTGGDGDAGIDASRGNDAGSDASAPRDTAPPVGDGGLDAAGSSADSGLDAALAADAGHDAALDAGPACEGMMSGSCPSGFQCLSCPTGPISETFLCTTMCAHDSDCTDTSRPHCAIDTFSHATMGICTPTSIHCIYGAVCASPDTMIATPSGERPIADLAVGDLVYTADEGALRAVPLSAVYQTPVSDHRVVRVELESGRILEISPGHPTADGRTFGDLRAGDRLDGARVVSAELVPYMHGFTYDILPASDTGTYVAGGALIGSTLTGAGAPVALDLAH